MKKPIDQVLNEIIGIFGGFFVGHCIYVVWNRIMHPDIYAAQSAPWYTSILLWGAVTAVVLLTILIIKWLIRKK